MIPLLMALCAILPYTTLTEANLINAITQFTPDAVNGMVIRIVSDVYARSAGTITVFALVTIWSAAKAMLALIYGLNAVNDVEEKRNYFVLRAIAWLLYGDYSGGDAGGAFCDGVRQCDRGYSSPGYSAASSGGACDYAFPLPCFVGGSDFDFCHDLCLCAELQTAV